MIVGGRPFRVVGHRGAAARAPENTAISLETGLAAGADQIEIDVGLTRDGRAVLLHDTTLDRTTSGRGLLRGRDWKSVSSLDAGSWFDRRFSGERAIDLDDALAIVRPRAVLIVEVKPVAREIESGIDPADRDTVDAVLAAFQRTGGVRGVTLSSKAWTLLEYAASRAAALDVALTVSRTESRDPVRWASRLKAGALHPNRSLCSPAYVARAHAAGLLVIPYTVNRAAELAPLLEAGVDGVFTDDPGAMRRLLARGAAPDPADSPLALGIDQGSGGTRAVLLDAANRIVAERAARIAQRRGRDGVIVQDPEAIAASVSRVVGPLLRDSSRNKVAVAGLAVQRSSLLVWRASDAHPVTPVLSWRSTGPGGGACLDAHEPEIHRSTGLTGRHAYGAIRLGALCRQSPEIEAGLRARRLVAGPLGAFLVARLCDGGPPPCDPSLAQRTLAYDIGARGFSPTLSALFGVDAAFWPAVAPSTGARGRLRVGRRGVSLHAVLGDVGAAARAVLRDITSPDEGSLVLGTGGFVVAPIGRKPRFVDGLLTSLLYEDAGGPVFGVEGTVHGLAPSLVAAGRAGGWSELPVERIAARSGTAGRIPQIDAAPEGTGTPDWDPTPRFAIEPGPFAPEEIVRGTIEDLAGRFGLIAGLMRAADCLPRRFVATGGLAFAPHLTARIEDRMGVAVVVDREPHRTAVGAAILARDGR